MSVLTGESSEDMNFGGLDAYLRSTFTPDFVDAAVNIAENSGDTRSAVDEFLCERGAGIEIRLNSEMILSGVGMEYSGIDNQNYKYLLDACRDASNQVAIGRIIKFLSSEGLLPNGDLVNLPACIAHDFVMSGSSFLRNGASVSKHLFESDIPKLSVKSPNITAGMILKMAEDSSTGSTKLGKILEIANRYDHPVASYHSDEQRRYISKRFDILKAIASNPNVDNDLLQSLLGSSFVLDSKNKRQILGDIVRANPNFVEAEEEVSDDEQVNSVVDGFRARLERFFK